MYPHCSRLLVSRSLLLRLTVTSNANGCRSHFPIYSGCSLVDIPKQPLQFQPWFQQSCPITTTHSLCKAAVKKKLPSLRDKYMKGQSKKSSTQTFDIWDTINTVDLAKVLKIEPDELFEVMFTIDENLLYDERQPIRSREVLKDVAKKFRCKFKFIADPRRRALSDAESIAENLDVVHPPPKLEDLKPRPPVCAIVGHIDHGKTSLLDYLRKSSIVSMEVSY